VIVKTSRPDRFRKHKKDLSPWGGKLSIVAFNDGGSSASRFSTRVDPMEWMCP
jgi:hypothetical protein